MDEDYFMADQQLKAVYEILGECFDSPCNFGFNGLDMTTDEYMLEKAPDWCEENCGKVSDAVCWQKFFELRIAERR